jgi:hypothetical protein
LAIGQLGGGIEPVDRGCLYGTWTLRIMRSYPRLILRALRVCRITRFLGMFVISLVLKKTRRKIR